MFEVRDTTTGQVLARRMRSAHTHWTRLRGLLGTESLPEDEALWIKPCQQVHMIGMRYALDVVFLDEQHRVLSVVENLTPGKLSPKVAAARSVIEFPVGTIARTGLAAGAQLQIDGEPEASRSEWVDNAAAALCNVALAGCYALFAAAHLKAMRGSAQWYMMLPFVIQEGMLVMLFLTRRRSFGTTGNVFDWFVGVAGTALPLLIRPAAEASAMAVIGLPIHLFGFCLAIFGLGSLGRSIGVVAANRGVQTSGFYRLVRHPMYAAYSVSYVGYVLCYPTPRNLTLIAISLLALFLRAVAEERFLSRDPVYRGYLEQVPWRFVPRVF